MQAPRYLRSDNGPEFVATAILRWLQAAGIETAFIDPGKPWQNGTDESFNGKFRNECLTVEWFRSANTFTWIAAAGNYELQVHVRSAGAAAVEGWASTGQFFVT